MAGQRREIQEPTAVWRGRRFRTYTAIHRPFDHVLLTAMPGDEVPSDFIHIPEWGGRAKEVPKDDLEAWWATKWYFTWRGVDFGVWEFRDRTLTGSTSGCTETWARENALGILDRAAYVGEFRYDEVEDLHEVRTDLLAKWRGRKRS